MKYFVLMDINVIIPLTSRCLIAEGKFFMKSCCNEIKSPSTDV